MTQIFNKRRGRCAERKMEKWDDAYDQKEKLEILSTWVFTRHVRHQWTHKDVEGVSYSKRNENHEKASTN